LEYVVASFAVIEHLRELLGKRGGYLDAVLRFNSFMDQSGDAANRLFDSRTISSLEDNFRNGMLPDAGATVLFLKMVNAALAPIEDPNFGTPLECVRSMWSGLQALRQWRNYVRLDDKLTLGENFVSLAMYVTFEVIIHGATNHYLACKRHAPGLEWRLKAALRGVCDTRTIEGLFALMRTGKIGHHNSVNNHLAGFIDTLSKVIASNRAKLNLRKAGVNVPVRRGKLTTWSIKEGDKGTWASFEVRVKTLGYDEFVREVAEAKRLGQLDGDALVEEFAPAVAEFLKGAGVWDKPVVKPEWRTVLEEREIKFTTVSGDEPVLPGKLPVAPHLFELDQRAAADGAAQAKLWDENLRAQGCPQYVAAATAAPARMKPRSPALQATITLNSVKLNGVLVSMTNIGDGMLLSVITLVCTSEPNLSGFASAPSASAEEQAALCLDELETDLSLSQRHDALTAAGFDLSSVEIEALHLGGCDGTAAVSIMPEWAVNALDGIEGSGDTTRVYVSDDNKTIFLDQTVLTPAAAETSEDPAR
jgi:hypothetical protein